MISSYRVPSVCINLSCNCCLLYTSSAVLILRGKEHSDSEASIALFSGGALAVGTFVLSAAKGMNMDAVSYTHLDVYKRQISSYSRS